MTFTYILDRAARATDPQGLRRGSKAPRKDEVADEETTPRDSPFQGEVPRLGVHLHERSLGRLRVAEGARVA